MVWNQKEVMEYLWLSASQTESEEREMADEPIGSDWSVRKVTSLGGRHDTPMGGFSEAYSTITGRGGLHEEVKLWRTLRKIQGRG